MRAVTVLIDGNRGIYIPQQFAKTQNLDPEYFKGATQEDINILKAGPDHEDYWETWLQVVGEIKIRLDAREPGWYLLYEDGDLFAIPEEYEWDEAGQEWVLYDDIIETPEEQEYREDLHDNDECENT